MINVMLNLLLFVLKCHITIDAFFLRFIEKMKLSKSIHIDCIRNHLFLFLHYVSELGISHWPLIVLLLFHEHEILVLEEGVIKVLVH